MSAIAIIPARGNSQRIPKKNIRLFHGKPIIAYSIETARESGLFDSIMVSTDSDEIGDVAIRYRARVFWRTYDNGVRGTQEVAAEVLRALPETPKYACCIYATAPLMTTEDLHEGFSLVQQPLVPFVYTVGPDRSDAGQWYWGKTSAFLAGRPLAEGTTWDLPWNRVCDINTPGDWDRAEQMYATLHPRKS